MPPKPRRYTDDEMHWALCHAMAHWCRRFRTELEPSMCAHVALKWANENDPRMPHWGFCYRPGERP